MGSYTKAHVISALGAPMMSDEYDYLAADQCVENLKKVGLSNENGKNMYLSAIMVAKLHKLE